MKTKLMIGLLISMPMVMRAMEIEPVEDAAAQNPLGELMTISGAANEDELAARVRSKVGRVERYGYDQIIGGLKYLAQKDPNALARLQVILAQKRSGDEKPVDQVTQLSAAVDILEGINGALAGGQAIANNWNQTDTAGKITQILDLTAQTLAKLDDRAQKTGCWGFCKRGAKASASAPAASAVADSSAQVAPQAK